MTSFGEVQIDALSAEDLEATVAAARSLHAQAVLVDHYQATDGYPYFVQAYGKAVWDVAPESPVTAGDVGVAGGPSGGQPDLAQPGGHLGKLAQAACPKRSQE